jgi:hypothetical protein
LWFKTNSDVQGHVELLLSNHEVMSRLQSRLLECLSETKVGIPDVLRTVSSCLNSLIPSHFYCGLQLIVTVMRGQMVRSCRDLFRNCFSVYFGWVFLCFREWVSRYWHCSAGAETGDWRGGIWSIADGCRQIDFTTLTEFDQSPFHSIWIHFCFVLFRFISLSEPNDPSPLISK